MRLKELLADLTHNDVLGPVAAYVYVIEFQKRGLPHTHILLWMEDGWRMLTPEHYDTVVRAEIPDPKNEPELHDLVVEHMLHNRCDILPHAPCLMNQHNKCVLIFHSTVMPAARVVENQQLHNQCVSAMTLHQSKHIVQS
jgi:hypothetical protein